MKNMKNASIALVSIILVSTVAGLYLRTVVAVESAIGVTVHDYYNREPLQNTVIPFTFDITGPAGWHRSGNQMSVRGWFGIPLGIYTCTVIYPITGETQTKTITVDEVEPHEGGYPHNFFFYFGKYIHPVQLDSTTMEWGYIPPHTDETHYARTLDIGDETWSTKFIDEHTVFPINTFFVLRNVTFWYSQENFEQAQLINYTTTNCTKEWIESHITQLFIDGLYAMTRNCDFDSVTGYAYYIKAHYAGLQYVDGYNLNGGYHSELNYPFRGLAYTVVLDELVFRTGYAGWKGVGVVDQWGHIITGVGSDVPAFYINNFMHEYLFHFKFGLQTYDDYTEFPATWMHVYYGPASEFDAAYITSGYGFEGEHGIEGEAQHYTVLHGVPVQDTVTDFWNNLALLPPNLKGSIDYTIPTDIYGIPTVYIVAIGITTFVVFVIVVPRIVVPRKRKKW